MVFCATPFLFVLLAFELVKIVHIVVIMLNIAWEIIFIQFRGQGMNNYKNIQNFLDHAYNSQKYDKWIAISKRAFDVQKYMENVL